MRARVENLLWADDKKCCGVVLEPWTLWLSRLLVVQSCSTCFFFFFTDGLETGMV